MSTQQILKEYRAAYKAANGTTPKLRSSGAGWYVVNKGYTKYRINEFPEMTRTLLGRALRQSAVVYTLADLGCSVESTPGGFQAIYQP